MLTKDDLMPIRILLAKRSVTQIQQVNLRSIIARDNLQGLPGSSLRNEKKNPNSLT